MKKKVVNVVDLFAGPGGLGEGFSSFNSEHLAFKIRMSVESEASAHKTLTLRAFYRLLKRAGLESSYHEYLEGRVSEGELKELHPNLWEQASAETMYGPTALGKDNDKIKSNLEQLKREFADEPWMVIGGPPCQAYSLVGRSRNKGVKGYQARQDQRHFLYKEYLNVLALLQPDVFVMENVKGILSSKVDETCIFPKILEDLRNPTTAIGHGGKGRSYRIFSFVKPPNDYSNNSATYYDSRDFIIRSERFGIPQARHRVILFGVANDILYKHRTLKEKPEITVGEVLSGLPALRSKLSKETDSPENWCLAIRQYVKQIEQSTKGVNKLIPVIQRMKNAASQLQYQAPVESREYPRLGSWSTPKTYLEEWLLRDMPKLVLNHQSRAHIRGDLARYLFSSCWADSTVYGGTDRPFPKSEDYPEVLSPAHANWKSGKFSDRFRVQRQNRPSTTITSHIAKDGHYFIHPDATQCRSLTVREAARIQTFPDNYFFEGNRTQQYVQVGNAVPPLLALQLASLVSRVFTT